MTLSRYRRVGLVALAVLVLGAAGYLVAAFSYDLAPGTTTVCAARRVTPEGATECRYPFIAGSTVELAVTVANPGAVPVRITAATIPIAWPGVTVQTPQFQPTTVRPDAELLVWLTIQLGGEALPPPCAGFSVERIQVDFTVLGLPRTAQVPLGFALNVEARSGGETAESPC